MVHLYNKIYIDNHVFYTSYKEGKVLSSEPLPHPLVKLVKDYFAILPSFDDLLVKSYSGSVENFWSEMASRNKNSSLTLYVDMKLELRLKISLWKSIFARPDIGRLHWLHNSSVLERRLRAIEYSQTIKRSREEIANELPFISRDEFTKIYESTQASGLLTSLPRECLSFEYLLADFYFDGGSKYSDDFKNKLADIAWRAWYSDISILREDLLNSIHNLNGIYPDAGLEISAPENYELILKNYSMTQWLFDPDFNKDTAYLTPQKYDVSTFTLPYKKIFEYLTKDQNAYETIQKRFLLPIDDPVLKTELLFSGKYEEFLEMSVDQKFSSVYSNGALSGKTNSALLSLIFDHVRSGKKNQLCDFQLI